MLEVQASEDRALHIDRRRFITRALQLAWMTPVVFTLSAESAIAQTPTCGTTAASGAPCTQTGSCPCSRDNCCNTSGNNSGGTTCGCYTTPPTAHSRCATVKLPCG